MVVSRKKGKTTGVRRILSSLDIIIGFQRGNYLLPSFSAASRQHAAKKAVMATIAMRPMEKNQKLQMRNHLAE
jgi:hypothetical protein